MSLANALCVACANLSDLNLEKSHMAIVQDWILKVSCFEDSIRSWVMSEDLHLRVNVSTFQSFTFTLWLFSSKYIFKTIHPQQRLLFFPLA